MRISRTSCQKSNLVHCNGATQIKLNLSARTRAPSRGGITIDCIDGRISDGLAASRDRNWLHLDWCRAGRNRGYNEEAKPFNAQQIQLEEGDIIYLFSDGFKDQFGGRNGKKLGYKKLVKTLRNISHENCNKQKKLLELFFDAWKGDLEQIDDVLLFGVKI